MAITGTDLLFKLTGATTHDAATPSDPDLSLGEYRTSNEITSGVDNNLFDDVSGDEASAGDIEYRAIAFHNNHGSLPLTSVVTWIEVDTGNVDDDISFAGETPSDETNGYIQDIADEGTAPTAVTFSDATTKGTGQDCPNASNEVGSGKWFGIWLRRDIGVGAAAKTAEAVTIRVEGDTAA